jgi:hypothetical protein
MLYILSRINEVSVYIQKTTIVFISSVSASLDNERSAGTKAHSLKEAQSSEASDTSLKFKSYGVLLLD